MSHLRPRMCRAAVALVALAALTTLLASSAAADPELRRLLQERPLQDLSGEAASPELAENSVVLVNFWADWCRPCRHELPILDQWKQEWQGQAVEFVCINIGKEARKARRMADQLELSLPLYHDGPDGLARELDLPAIPITYVLGPDGSVTKVSTGSDEKSLAELRQHVDSLLRDPRVAQRRATNANAEAR